MFLECARVQPVSRVGRGMAEQYTGLFGALHLKDLPIIKNYPYGVCTRVAGYTILF